MERSDGETVGKGEDCEGELQKWGPRRQEARGQGEDTSGSGGLHQVHAELRGSASVEKCGDRSGVLNRDERGEEEPDLGVKPFHDLTGEGAWGGPEGLDQSGVRDVQDQGSVRRIGAVIP